MPITPKRGSFLHAESQAILEGRESIKPKTIEQRRRLHQQAIAA
jgi:hypothetical protein